MSIWYWITINATTTDLSADLLSVVNACIQHNFDILSSKDERLLTPTEAINDWCIIDNFDVKQIYINNADLGTSIILHDHELHLGKFGLSLSAQDSRWKKHFVDYNHDYQDLARYAFLFLNLIKNLTITKFEIDTDLDPWITTPFFGIRTILYGGTLEEDMLKLFNNIKKHSMHLSYQDTLSTSNEVTFTNALVELKEFGVSTYNLDSNGISVRISFYNSFFILQPLDANGTLHHNPTSDAFKKLIKIALFLCDDFRIERIEMNFGEEGITCI